MNSPYYRGAAARRTAVQTIVPTVGCLIAVALGIVAVLLIITGNQSPAATAPLKIPSTHRVPTVCGRLGGSLTIHLPTRDGDLGEDRIPS